MSVSRGMAVAIALLLAAFAVAGCGLGAGRQLGEASLTVTRDYGAERLLGPTAEGVTESDTVMRVLERNADVSTRYGGDYVHSIEGVSEAVHDGHPLDWFFYVNGVESPVGAADYSLHGGEAIWWDYRDWSAAISVPAVVGSWPQPFVGGYEGHDHPVRVECLGGGAACAEVQRRLRQAGALLGGGVAGGPIRILVGPWGRVRADPAAAQIEDGPRQSGVFAVIMRESGDFALRGLDETGAEARAFGPGAGLVAATRRHEAPPVWVVSGATERGVAAAAALLDRADLRDHYAVAVEDGQESPLPIR